MKNLFCVVVAVGVLSLTAFQLSISRLPIRQHLHNTLSFSSFTSTRFHHSSTPLYASSVINAEFDQPKHNHNSFFSQAKSTVIYIAKQALPFVVAFGIMYLLNVPMSMAASKGRKAATAAAAVTAVAPKSPPLWRKILEGANVTGNFKKWKPGDTRSEFAALVNAATTVIIMLGLVLVGSLNHLRRHISEERNMKSEVLRVREYKENMYFDAVEDILKKLADPKLKSANKSSLQAQLKDLDPDGIITRFVRDGGERPDISYLMGKKPKKGARKAGSGSSAGTVERRPKKPAPSRDTYEDDDDESETASKAFSNKNEDDDDDDDDEEEDSDTQKFNFKSPAKKPTDDSENSNQSFRARQTNRKQAFSTDDDSVNKVGGGARSGISSGGNSNDSEDDASSGQDYSQSVVYRRVLSELDKNLEAKMANWRRAKLIAYLKTRIEGTLDDNKRASVVSKIADRLDQVDYWVEYASKLP